MQWVWCGDTSLQQCQACFLMLQKTKAIVVVKANIYGKQGDFPDCVDHQTASPLDVTFFDILTRLGSAFLQQLLSPDPGMATHNFHKELIKH